ncbi:Guanosine-5'-triphosphate,3'-diphosphate pyrophosphatase [Gossypium australe]|uniref:Guanosine-5'-triphosphate,3'-diphosphate pyrophosphatase n=1 Tax=Gossypium australe TaxID=47621 RepID=A0A5B6W0F7_9ROSI|nr:Guanosine-5'-triphosphate,3'-diphosphate pyrophosphatase [Gossypium australe]
MSFLAGRLAGKEGAFFFQESKQAVNRLVEKTPKNLPSNPPSLEQQTQADILPEVLKHSLPSKIFRQPSDASSLSRSSKWALHTHPTNASSSSPDALNPLRAYVSLPQVTFGPKRWELPTTEHSTMASTANELRKDKYTPLNPEKLKAAAEGLKRIGMAFVVATTMVFGGAALMFGIAASKLELHSVSITYYTLIDNFLSSITNAFSLISVMPLCVKSDDMLVKSDDVRTKGKDLVQPKFEMIREQLVPLRTWAENTSKKWHLEREESIKDKPIIKELSKTLGAKTNN